jgi:nitrogen fixation protein FixH
MPGQTPIREASNSEQVQVEGPTSKEIMARQETTARRWWTLGVCTLLGTQIAIGVVAITLANNDSTVAIIPNYYSAAVNWDATRRARERFQDLGWTADIGASSVFEKQRSVTVSLMTEDQQPIVDHRVTAQVFHHANGSDIHTLKFEDVGSGLYTAESSLLRAGLWSVKLRIEGERGVAELVRDVWVEN